MEGVQGVSGDGAKKRNPLRIFEEEYVPPTSSDDSGAENRRFDVKIETYSMVRITVKIWASSLTGVRVAEKWCSGTTLCRHPGHRRVT